MREMNSAVTRGNKPHDVRCNNQRAVIQLLYQHGEMALPEIAEHLGLSRTAVMKIARELTKQNLLTESGKRLSSKNGGRPPTLFTVNRDYRYAVAILINPLDFDCTLMDMWYEPRMQIHQEFTAEELSDRGAMILAIATAFDRLMEEMCLTRDDACGVAVMVKGVVDVEGGVVVFPIGTEWEANMPMRDDLAEALGFEVPVFIENACRYMGYAELLSFPAYRDELIVVIASGPHGVGGCVVDHGNLSHGANGFVGEIGHMIVDPFSRRLCDCGSLGCLEALINKTAVIDYAMEFAADYQESELSEKARSQRLYDEKDVFDAADRGDALACKVMDILALYLAVGIHNIMVTVDPNRVVLVGRFCLMGDYFLNKLRKELTLFPKFVLDSPTEIVLSNYRGTQNELTACMRGAACYAITQYLQDMEKHSKSEIASR